MKFQELDFSSIMLGTLSILPWAWVVYHTYPKEKRNPSRLFFAIVLGILGGILATSLILSINPILWPEVDVRARRPKSILTQTIHIAFIQAGMVEEAFKTLFILLFGLFFFQKRTNPLMNESQFPFIRRFLSPHWSELVVPLAAFTALGFAMVENSYYIHSEIPERKLETLIGRTLYSSNIHLLINLCFGLFLMKSNRKEYPLSKWGIVGLAFGLAVIQHGVVDFFLIPSSSIGGWIATAMFVGIWVWVVRDFRYYILNQKWEPI